MGRQFVQYVILQIRANSKLRTEGYDWNFEKIISFPRVTHHSDNMLRI